MLAPVALHVFPRPPFRSLTFFGAMLLPSDTRYAPGRRTPPRLGIGNVLTNNVLLLCAFIFTYHGRVFFWSQT